MRAKDGLKQLLREFGIDPDSDPGLKLQTYLSLLEKWNPRVNLTSNIAWIALEPMFREGIWAAAKYPAGFRAHLDIGSGAGFPAIILRVFNTEMELDLVESRGKKGAFLETAAWELGLTGTQVDVERLENFLAACESGTTWDCVSWKAIRLADRDLLRLHDHMDKNSLFWMFHGKEAAVEDVRTLDENFILADKQPVPGQKESFLSIYRSRNPDCFT
jgi:16S rRNA (guanine(527)-N(7))-methyltransferase RsmG